MRILALNSFNLEVVGLSAIKHKIEVLHSKRANNNMVIRLTRDNVQHALSSVLVRVGQATHRHPHCGLVSLEVEVELVVPQVGVLGIRARRSEVALLVVGVGTISCALKVI